MIMINIHEAKTHLSRYIKILESGEKIILCKRNKPIGEIIPILEESAYSERPVGLAKGEFSVPNSFFDDLPLDIINGFSGK